MRRILTASALVAVLLLPFSVGSVSATEHPNVSEETLCDQLATLWIESKKGRISGQYVSNIQKACDTLAGLRDDTTLYDLDYFQGLIERAEISLSELGVSEEELATFELKVLPQKMRKVFEDTSYDLSRLERSPGNIYEVILNGFLHTSLKESLIDLLKKYQKVSDALRIEIQLYRDKIILCSTQEPLPDAFWNRIDETVEEIMRVNFGKARAVFGEAHGQLAVYDELFSLCAKEE